jgi:hypothetical protein
MLWDVDTDLDKLTAAPEARDKSATRAFCDDLIARIYKTAEPYPLNPAKKLLLALRKRRFFEQMERLADAFIQTGSGSATVRRLMYRRFSTRDTSPPRCWFLNAS